MVYYALELQRRIAEQSEPLENILCPQLEGKVLVKLIAV